MKKTLLIFAIVLALSTVLWYWDKATRVKATSSVKNTQQAEAKIDGKPAPEVKFKGLDGNDVTLAQYKGTGTINGSGNYNFLLTALDGSPDGFRIKITDSNSIVVYDNKISSDDTMSTQNTQALGGGSIVIHK